jgi:hypothetical protein
MSNNSTENNRKAHAKRLITLADQVENNNLAALFYATLSEDGAAEINGYADGLCPSCLSEFMTEVAEAIMSKSQELENNKSDLH